MYISKCDKCGKTVEGTLGKSYKGAPDNWIDIKYQINNYDLVLYLICPDCAKAMKIPEDKTRQRNIGDRLIDIISEIASCHDRSI